MLRKAITLAAAVLLGGALLSTGTAQDNSVPRSTSAGTST